ncbi:rhomboid family intramembrane serine protease [uncultured Polaribacter sp.]|uniref:rhomboid family intramembrane serine protease n=1 Tax=uncultured Polaribacter sp. TaxID=174711 RepID=UPI00260D8AB0|nr:rhomboid family intramembrane serine protease [uncultured Polaribacter sp.]
MNKQNEIDTTKSIFLIPTIYVVGIWVLYFVEIKFGFNFNKFGVYPRDLLGLRGVVFTHFIHSDTNHLFNNSIPLFVLLASLYSFYNQVALKVLIYGGLCTGLLTWCIARESYHIGASGIIYLLFSFVFFSGIIRKHYRLVALSLIIIFLYGSMIWYVLPIKEGMSWEGHLSGFIMGLILAFIYKNKGIVKEEHQFTATEFDLMFDSDGNFIPPEIEEKLDDKIID